MNRKGIILAGGSGTRLYPLTLATTKCMLPVYDKPMVYYSISTLMLSGIKDILLISTPEDKNIFQRLLGDGSKWGINLSFDIQPKPEGIAQALRIGERFLQNNPSALMLADNIFYGSGFSDKLINANLSDSNTLFAYEVPDPERFGVCSLDSQRKVISLEEKPKSHLQI